MIPSHCGCVIGSWLLTLWIGFLRHEFFSIQHLMLLPAVSYFKKAYSKSRGPISAHGNMYNQFLHFSLCGMHVGIKIFVQFYHVIISKTEAEQDTCRTLIQIRCREQPHAWPRARHETKCAGRCERIAAKAHHIKLCKVLSLASIL